jgi:HSP20 family protein
MSETPLVRKSESIFDELQKMQERITQRAYEIFSANGEAGRDMDNWLAAERELVWKPCIELTEKDNQFNLCIELPGIEAKDLKIEVTPEELLVTAETRQEKTEADDKVYTSELKTGSLFRAVTFPRQVNTDKVKAELKNGLLLITAPVAEKQTAKKVAIQAA